MTTYRRIGAVTTTAQILKFLADQREPVSGQEISRALGLPHGTVMSHLATLEDENFTRRIGEHYETGQTLAAIWARKKANLSARIDKISNELRELEV